MARTGRGRGQGRGRGNTVVESERVTRARIRREPLESPELSPDDSPFDPVISEEEESSEVSLTESEGVERVDDIEEAELVEAKEE